MSSRSDFDWICGSDKNIVHRRFVDNGGVGDVHEMASVDTGQLFARKVIRIVGQANRLAVEDEARVISEFIQEDNQCEHIIKYLAHGWLPSQASVYYIDMELAAMTLTEFIKIFRTAETKESSRQRGPAVNSQFFQYGTPLGRIHIVWTIGLHIALGLQSLHIQGHIHRNLKSSNVLYCMSEDVWKIADFGTATQATSTEITKQFSTSSYRAPETLGKQPKISDKVDIWALGCILIEIATGSRPFQSDSAEAPKGSEKPPSVCLSQYEFWNHHFQHFTSECLAKRPEHRPESSSVCRVLYAYRVLLSQQQFDVDCLKSSNVLPYDKWKAIVSSSTYEAELLYNVVTALSSPRPALVRTLSRSKSSFSKPEFLSKIAMLAYETDNFWLTPLVVNKNGTDETVSYWWEILHGLEIGGKTNEATYLLYSILRDIPDRVNTGGVPTELPSLPDERLPPNLFNTLNTIREWLNLCGPQIHLKDSASIFPPQHEYYEFNYILQKRMQSALDAFDMKFTGPSFLPGGTLTDFLQQKNFPPPHPYSLLPHPIKEGMHVLNLLLRVYYVIPFYVCHSKQPLQMGVHCAAWCGNTVVLQSYVSKQKAETPKARNINQLMPLHLAVWGGQKTAVEMLLQADPSTVGTRATEEWLKATPLHLAVFSHETILLNMLLTNAETGLNPSDTFARTPVHYAVFLNNIHALRILLSHGASTTSRDRFGYTPAHYAAIKGHIEILEVLKNDGGVAQANLYRDTPLVCAAFLGRLEAVKCLLTDCADEDEYTRAVDGATASEQWKVVEYLCSVRNSPRPAGNELIL